jgi:hypothetical protein
MYRKKKKLLLPQHSFFFNSIAMECPLMKEKEVNAMLDL